MNLDEIKPAIRAIAEKHNLEFAVLFGSQATGATHAGSDVDIGVISRDKINVPRLMSEFSEVLKRGDVQIIDLSQASPTLMYAVVKDGKELYEYEPSAFFAWKLYAIKIWMETAWLRAMRDKKIREWVSN